MPKNQLFYGDNLDVLRRHIPDQSVDLVYLDPPFNSRQDYNVLFSEKSGERRQFADQGIRGYMGVERGLTPRVRGDRRKGRPRLRGDAGLQDFLLNAGGKTAGAAMIQGSIYFALRVLTVLAFGSASIAFAQTGSQNTSNPQVPSQLTVMGFTLGKSTLADVQARLGRSVPRKCSQEEEAGKEICYVSAGKDHTKVVFEAGFSGGWKELDGYKVIAGSVARRCYRKCPRADNVTRDVQTEGGLKLGLTREQLMTLLGAPKEVRGNNLTFQWQSRQAMTNEQVEAESRTLKSSVTDAYYDVQDTIEIMLANSRVVEFRVQHIVTY